MNARTIIDRLARAGALTCLALLIGLTTVAAAAAPPPASLDIAAIDTYVSAQMHEQRFPGLALAIVHGDHIMHLKGFGVADPSGRAITPQTPFIIGSTTKSFTALAIMQLVEAGKIELDAPIQRYLPAFRVADSAASRLVPHHDAHNSAAATTQGADHRGTRP